MMYGDGVWGTIDFYVKSFYEKEPCSGGRQIVKFGVLARPCDRNSSSSELVFVNIGHWRGLALTFRRVITTLGCWLTGMKVVLRMVLLRLPRRSRKMYWVSPKMLRSWISNLFLLVPNPILLLLREKGLLVMFLVTINSFWELYMAVMMFKEMMCCH